MDDRDRQIMRSNRVTLVKNLKVSEDLLSFLISKRIINEDMKEEITEVHKTRSARAGALLDMLPRRGPHAFRAFVEGLVESDQGYMADLINKDIADKYRDQSGRPRDAGYPEGPPAKLAEGMGLGPSLPLPNLDTTDTFLDINKMRNSRSERVQKVLAEEENCYPMTGCPRGRVIILNVEKFQDDQHSERQGSNIDVVNITETFKKLGFTVDLWKDLSKKDLWVKVQEERMNPDHLKSSAFIMFMLSHGKEGIIYTSDNAEMSINQVVSQFDGKLCQALAGKPKLFFIQACQGTKKTEGVQADDEEDLNDDEVMNLSMGQMDDADSVADVLRTVHEKGDVLVAYSTVPGYKSWRHTSQGSWFMRDLVTTFIQRADEEHVLDMMTKINRAIEKRSQENMEGFRQICKFESTLSRAVYFLPGYNTTLSKAE